MKLILTANYVARGRSDKYCNQHVCLSVCSDISNTTHPNFIKYSAHYLWLQLYPPLIHMQYFIYFHYFVDNIMFWHNGWFGKWLSQYQCGCNTAGSSHKFPTYLPGNLYTVWLFRQIQWNERKLCNRNKVVYIQLPSLLLIISSQPVLHVFALTNCSTIRYDNDIFTVCSKAEKLA